MTLRTYEVVRASPDELIVYAHLWYVGLMIAAVGGAIAIAALVKSGDGKSANWVTPFFGLQAVFFLFLSLNHGKMTFDKAKNTFTADRTHWYLGTDHTATTLDEVGAARLTHANTSYQVCVVLHHSNQCVAIYPLDSAAGQDDAVIAIENFLQEHREQRSPLLPADPGAAADSQPPDEGSGR